MSAVPESVAAAGLEALRSGWLTMGPRTQALEEALAQRFGAAQAVATSSGTAALHLSCLALEAGPGTEVLVPALGPASTAGAPTAAGAAPRAWDSATIDPAAEQALREASETTRALIVRHPGGMPAELGELPDRCAAEDIALIEDCREAIGAVAANGVPVGRLGRVAILSFCAGRQIGAGEGGAVLTDDEEVAATVRSLRSHAMTSGTWDRHRGHAETYDVVGVGFNYRIDEVRAAMAAAGLERLDAEIDERRGRLVELRERVEAEGAQLLGAERIERSSPLYGCVVVAEGQSPDELAAALGRPECFPAGFVQPAADPDRSPQAAALAARLLLPVV